MSVAQLDHAPSHLGVAAGALHGGEDMGAERTIGVPYGDRALQDGSKALPDIKALGLAADEDRYRLEIARHLARRLGRDDARALRRHSGFARRGLRTELRL